MCNINVVFNRRKVDDVRVNELMNVMSFNSFLNNSDGEGFISLSGKKVLSTDRSRGKIIYSGKPSYFLATHQRIATSGKNDANIHPHPTENLILLHNGIFSGKGDKDESDTRQYLRLLDDTYIANGGDIVKSIKDVSKIVSGTYSILVYEIKTGKFFYFKEDCTNMYVVANDDWLVLSTNYNNIKYARNYLKIKQNVREVKPFRIYDVLKGFKRVAFFSPKKSVVNSKDACLSDFVKDDFKDYFKDATGLMLDEIEINRGGD